MTIFPNIKEQMVIFVLETAYQFVQVFLNTTTKKNKNRKFTVVKNLRVSKGTSVYGSEYR